MNRRITVHIEASRPYDIIIGRGILTESGERIRTVLPKVQKIMLVGDDITAGLYGKNVVDSLTEAGFSVVQFIFPQGEANKNITTFAALLEELATAGLTRSDCIVALGGGVVGDLAGFAAACFLRGIDFVQIPTTVLAAVDSSVGGKTAVDLSCGKNLAGAFHQPSLVLCDPDVFATLPHRIFSDGCAEIIKYGFISDPALLEKLSHTDVYKLQAGDAIEEILADCVRDKAVYVTADEQDRGIRQLLNLGHTIGHGVEAASDFAVSHGSAVAIGMHLVTCGAVKKGICPPETLQLLEKLLAAYDLPMVCPFETQTLYSAALSDKKRAGGMITLVLPTAVGQSQLFPMPVEELLPFLELCLSDI